MTKPQRVLLTRTTSLSPQTTMPKMVFAVQCWKHPADKWFWALLPCFCTLQDEGHSWQFKFVHILLKLTSSDVLEELSDIQLKLRKTVKIVFFVQCLSQQCCHNLKISSHIIVTLLMSEPCVKFNALPYKGVLLLVSCRRFSCHKICKFYL